MGRGAAIGGLAAALDGFGCWLLSLAGFGRPVVPTRRQNAEEKQRCTQGELFDQDDVGDAALAGVVEAVVVAGVGDDAVGARPERA